MMQQSQDTKCVFALCANSGILPGLYATLLSLTQSLCQPNKAKIYLFAHGISPCDFDRLRDLVARSGAQLIIKAVTPSMFYSLRALQGDWMAYMRLSLARLLPDSDRIVYLDSDLIVRKDVSVLLEVDMHTHILAASGVGPARRSLEWNFFCERGMAEYNSVFNSGVLIIDAVRWRQENIEAEALKFGRTYSVNLASADQTILNVLFAGNFFPLSNDWNVGLYPQTETLTGNDAVFHFVGSPKPWDIGGRLFHKNWWLWHDTVAKTEFKWMPFLMRHGVSYFRRAWVIRRSYLRTAWCFWNER